MESQTRFSKHLHELFLERFKGKIGSIGREGVAANALVCTRPVDKSPNHKYADVYTPSQKMPAVEQPKRESYPSVVLERAVLRSHRCTQSLALNCIPGVLQPGPERTQPMQSELCYVGSPSRSNKCASGETVSFKQKGPTRRQSLPRSYRSARRPSELSPKEEMDPKRREKARTQIESLARINFQRIGYMSLSIANGGVFRQFQECGNRGQKYACSRPGEETTRNSCRGHDNIILDVGNRIVHQLA